MVFDLGKVLLDFDYGRAAARMSPFSQTALDDILSTLNQSPLLYRYETGLISTAEFFEEVKTAARFEHGFEQFEELFSDIFSPITEMIEWHARLRRRGLPTYIFSNTNEMAVRYIRRSFHFFADFEGHIFSFEHCSMKPDPKIYEVVEKVAGLRGPALLYIDDRAENIEQGRARGWQSIHHCAPADTIPRVEKLLAGSA